MVSKLATTWPARRSTTAGPLPLYGTMHELGPGEELEQLAARCCVLPTPDDA